MPEFVVRIGWPDGGVAEESITTASSAAARVEFERRGAHVFEIRARSRRLSLKPSRRRKIRMSSFLVFNQELVSLLKAGLPILRSIELLLDRQANPTWKEVLTDIRDRITSGASLSDAFAAQGDLFPRLYATSLKAGERSGELEPVLRRFLKYQKTMVVLQRKVVSTLVYPGLLISVSAGLIAIMMTFVVPRFTDFFGELGAELPLLTRVVIGTALAIRTHLSAIVLAGATGLFAARHYARTERGKEFFDRSYLKLPFVGGIFRRFAAITERQLFVSP